MYEEVSEFVVQGSICDIAWLAVVAMDAMRINVCFVCGGRWVHVCVCFYSEMIIIVI